jgi:hypothetical protein
VHAAHHSNNSNNNKEHRRKQSILGKFFLSHFIRPKDRVGFRASIAVQYYCPKNRASLNEGRTSYILLATFFGREGP